MSYKSFALCSCRSCDSWSLKTAVANSGVRKSSKRNFRKYERVRRVRKGLCVLRWSFETVSCQNKSHRGRRSRDELSMIAPHRRSLQVRLPKRLYLLGLPVLVSVYRLFGPHCDAPLRLCSRQDGRVLRRRMYDDVCRYLKVEGRIVRFTSLSVRSVRNPSPVIRSSSRLISASHVSHRRQDLCK